MPIYEHRCVACNGIKEAFYHTYDPSPPDCCGQPMQRLISMFRVVFTGPITARYNDKKLEGAHMDGFTAWRRHSAKDPRYPERCEIRTWEERRAFMRDEGLEEMPSNATISSTGEGGQDVKISTAGEPGCWV